MKHEWHEAVAQADMRPGGRVAELVEESIWAVHGPDVPCHGAGRRERRWADLIAAVTASPVPAAELCDAYLLHYYALGGKRPVTA